MRRVNSEDGPSVWPSHLSQRHIPRGGVARGELYLPFLVWVEKHQVAGDLVRPRMRRGHDADVHLEDRLVGRRGDGEGVPLPQAGLPAPHARLDVGALQVEVMALAVDERLLPLVADRVVELKGQHVRLTRPPDERGRGGVTGTGGGDRVVTGGGDRVVTGGGDGLPGCVAMMASAVT